MFGSTNDLQAVLRYQAELRDDAARRRRSRAGDATPKPTKPARRFLGLRLSLA